MSILRRTRWTCLGSACWAVEAWVARHITQRALHRQLDRLPLLLPPPDDFTEEEAEIRASAERIAHDYAQWAASRATAQRGAQAP